LNPVRSFDKSDLRWEGKASPFLIKFRPAMIEELRNYKNGMEVSKTERF
jgi:hypothetical protein